MALPAILAGAGGGGMLANSVRAFRFGVEAFKAIEGLLPTLVQDMDVVVTGMPHAKRYHLYWLAVSTAFGYISNFTVLGKTLPKGLIMLEYNAEQNHVRFYCKQISTWAQVWFNLKKADPLGRFTTQIFGGPKDISKGGKWEWYGAAFGLPGSPEDFGKLGWEKETILTKAPTYSPVAGGTLISENPYPDGDEVSRGPASIAADPAVVAIDPTYWYRNPERLLFQALSPPCNPNLSTPVTGSTIPIPPGAIGNPGAPPPVGVGPIGEPTPVMGGGRP